MDLILDALARFSGLMRPYLSEIGLSMVATLLVIFGQDVTNMLKQQIAGLKFFLKLTIFVVFCAFGFAFITSFITPIMVAWIAAISDTWLGLAIVAIFFGIGLIAQKKRMI